MAWRQTGSQEQDEKDWDQEGRPAKWTKNDKPGGKGASNWWGNGKRTWEPIETKPSLDAQTTELLKAITKLILKHEDELRRMRPDQDFMAFFDVGQHGFLEPIRQAAIQWQEKYSQDLVTSALKHIMFLGVVQELKVRLAATLQDDTKAQQYRALKWLVDGPTALTPAWNCFKWNPEIRAQEVCKDQAPLSHTEVVKQLDFLEQHIAEGNNLAKFGCTRPMAEAYQSEVVPFHITIGMRGQTADACHQALVMLTGSSALKLLGLRIRPGRPVRQPCAKYVEEAFLATPYCDWQQPRRQGRAPHARSGGR